MSPTTVMAFDFGRVRTGVAVGDLHVGVAHPLETVTAADDEQRLRAVEHLVREWAPGRFVVGLPSRDDGTEHPLAEAVRAFGASLEARLGLPVAYVDETLSSFAAGLALADNGVRGRRQKRHLDSAAAQVILQAYLDEHHASA